MKNRTVYITQGLPGSGKNTWANQFVVDNPNFVILCRDDLRKSFAPGYSKGTEDIITYLQYEMMGNLISKDRDVIIADTNLNPNTVQKIHDEIKFLNEYYKGSITVKAKIKSFLHIPLEVCVQRDLQRLESVGEHVIRKMHSKYVDKTSRFIDYVPNDSSLPDAYVFDLDGTLALNKQGRNFYDASTADEDSLHVPVYNALISHYASGYDIILFTAREDKPADRAATVRFCEKHQIPYVELIMRPAGDMRKDALVKREMYETHIKGHYNVMAVYDDRDQVVKMWRRELNIPCFQVAEGNF